MKERGRCHRPFLLMLILFAILAFLIFHISGIILVGDYTGAVLYSMFALIVLVLLASALRYFLRFLPDRIELRQGYNYSIGGSDPRRSPETKRAPFFKTVIPHSDIKSISVPMTKGDHDVIIEKTDGARIEIAFVGYFTKKEIITSFKALSERLSGSVAESDTKEAGS